MENITNFNYNINIIKFFRIISKHGISPVDWLDHMQPSKQGWANYQPTHRNPKWIPEEFFNKVSKKFWAFSSFYISTGRFDKKTIIQIDKEWRLEIDSINIIKNNKLNIKFDT